MKTNLIISLIAFLSIQTYCQTYFEGGIYDNTTWTAEGSPYILIGNVVVFPEKTLTIQPGVNIIFQDDYFLEVRGKLSACGTAADSIVFTSELTPTLTNEFFGIQILVPDASITCKYCKFINLMKPVWIQGVTDNGSNDTITNSTFANNIFAISGNGSSSGEVYINNCHFKENWVASAQMKNFSIINSIFSDNRIALKEPSDCIIENCIFQRDSISVNIFRKGTISNCLFDSVNIAIDVSSYNHVEITNNEIINCNIGLRLAFGNEPSYWIKSNKICNSVNFHIQNLDNINIDMTSNCWCEEDSLLVEEKIYDGYDNIASGLVNYDIYDQSCENILKSVIKVFIGIDEEVISPQKLLTYPNPSNGQFFIKFEQLPSGKPTIKVFNLSGREVFSSFLQKELVQQINVSQLLRGLYLIKIETEAHTLTDFIILE